MININHLLFKASNASEYKFETSLVIRVASLFIRVKSDFSFSVGFPKMSFLPVNFWSSRKMFQ